MPVVVAPDELYLGEDAPARDVDELLCRLERGEEVLPGGGRLVRRAVRVGQAVELEEREVVIPSFSKTSCAKLA